MTTHWARYIQHWELLRPPLRPHAEVIDRIRSLVETGEARCLLLGSTPEYAALDVEIIAVDVTFGFLAALWKNDKPARLAIQSDWARMPIKTGMLSHVLGDGSLNAVSTSVLPSVLDEVTRVLRPDGVLIARVFCRPEAAEHAEDIRRDVALGRVESFHALKWRIAMSALPDPSCSDIAVTLIRDAMVTQFPDREALCRMTAWQRAEIDTIDVYDRSTAVYNFPTEPMILATLRRWFQDVEAVPTGSYPLAERCPLIIARTPRRATQ